MVPAWSVRRGRHGRWVRRDAAFTQGGPERWAGITRPRRGDGGDRPWVSSALARASTHAASPGDPPYNAVRFTGAELAAGPLGYGDAVWPWPAIVHLW